MDESELLHKLISW